MTLYRSSCSCLCMPKYMCTSKNHSQWQLVIFFHPRHIGDVHIAASFNWCKVLHCDGILDTLEWISRSVLFQYTSLHVSETIYFPFMNSTQWSDNGELSMQLFFEHRIEKELNFQYIWQEQNKNVQVVMSENFLPIF